MKSGRGPVWQLMVAACACGASLACVAAPADEVKALVDQGRPAEAWQVAQRNMDQAGNLRFDLYAGIAAIHAGRHSEGVLILERVLLNAPDHVGARVELARGYYLLKDDDRARDEFEAVLALSPPPALAAVVREYLDALRDREAQQRVTAGFSLEFGGGKDSNVQSGVSDPNLTLPVFGAITLADSAVAAGDRYSLLGASGRVNVPLRAGLGLFLQAAAELKQHRTQDIYDLGSFSALAGFNWVRGDRVLRLSAGQTSQSLDRVHYRDTSSLGLDFGRPLLGNGVFSAGVQLASFSYTGANALRDAHYGALQGAYRYRLEGTLRAELDVGFSLAREDNQSGTHEELSRDLSGGRLGFNLVPAPGWTVAASLNGLKSRYRADDPLLQVARRDTYWVLDAALVRELSPEWSLRGEVQVSRNSSNIPLYPFKRRIAQLKLRYDFR
ncbi:MAG TPA: tetratricopeptide repeat protein [Usitatibacteraceae bacterium]|nr:tetratricopeptide repeat protein [Usitatibacteraceae bacterium]